MRRLWRNYRIEDKDSPPVLHKARLYYNTALYYSRAELSLFAKHCVQTLWDCTQFDSDWDCTDF